MTTQPMPHRERPRPVFIGKHNEVTAAAYGRKTDAQLAASYLGSLARGIPKRITPAESQRRSDRLAEARKKRWCKPVIKLVKKP